MNTIFPRLSALVRVPYCLALLFSLALHACGPSSPGVTPAATTQLPILPSPPSQTPTPRPSPTPPPPMVVLLAPPEADAVMAGELQSAFASLAAQSGLRFQTRPSLSPLELEQSMVVIALPPYPGLAELAASAAQTQFLAVGFTGLEARDNLSVVGAQAERPDQIAFLAGYTAALVTDNWRVAVVSETGTVAGKVARQGFINGVTFYCGLCRPPYPPYPAAGYPVSVELSVGAGSVDWQAAATYLNSWEVGAVYVQPALAEAGLLTALAEAGIDFILAGSPPAGLEVDWIASLGPQAPLEDALALWPDLVAGRGGQRIDLPLEFSRVNPELLSPGRQRLAEQVLADLLAGFIGAGVDPMTGEIP